MASKREDPFDKYQQGTIDFKPRHPQYEDTYTGRREDVRALAKKLQTQGYHVGSSTPGMWTAKRAKTKKP